MNYIPLDFNLKEDRNFLKGKWIVNKDTEEEYLMTAFTFRDGKWYANTSKGLFTSKALFNHYIFPNGEIIGKNG